MVVGGLVAVRDDVQARDVEHQRGDAEREALAVGGFWVRVPAIMGPSPRSGVALPIPAGSPQAKPPPSSPARRSIPVLRSPFRPRPPPHAPTGWRRSRPAAPSPAGTKTRSWNATISVKQPAALRSVTCAGSQPSTSSRFAPATRRARSVSPRPRSTAPSPVIAAAASSSGVALTRPGTCPPARRPARARSRARCARPRPRAPRARCARCPTGCRARWAGAGP